ncbi:hypothetical protein [Nesterenkonia alba]|uniref:hypothetical protein n=1 Tax=Nesterenkonia alba TaxID=515814 RepID=UPI000403CA77|nr:hypothetical protein [Nesterenkonia alba]
MDTQTSPQEADDDATGFGALPKLTHRDAGGATTRRDSSDFKERDVYGGRSRGEPAGAGCR